MKISDKPIEQQVSWLSSHAAGVLKARTLSEGEEDYWQVILNVTNEVASLNRLLDDAI